ncbi:CopG family ribbon-helix-helix protein [Methylibium sp.]|uniref:CopG family ribbon-helix-helix protein n=1 Tax=Methylibium sp. TaxID=2067992 RepID=UPI0025DCCFC5|nr:ribbon-helix-helix protein, CopG family [Methylibium sp.]
MADARHRSAHWLVREAIHQYVEREEKREAFRQDAMSAWNESSHWLACDDGRGRRLARQAGSSKGCRAA